MKLFEGDGFLKPLTTGGRGVPPLLLALGD
jgi:hypothetical protein